MLRRAAKENYREGGGKTEAGLGRGAYTSVLRTCGDDEWVFLDGFALEFGGLRVGGDGGEGLREGEEELEEGDEGRRVAPLALLGLGLTDAAAQAPAEAEEDGDRDH
jgi:hypothetical protein